MGTNTGVNTSAPVMQAAAPNVQAFSKENHRALLQDIWHPADRRVWIAQGARERPLGVAYWAAREPSAGPREANPPFGRTWK